MKKVLLFLTILLLSRTGYGQCPDLSTPRKPMASSFHSSILITHDSIVRYWGDAANTSGSGDVLSPLTLPKSSYGGASAIPLGVAAGSYTSAVHQLYIHSSVGIYGWGGSNNTINAAVSGAVGVTNIALPGGLTIDSVSFIEASSGGLAIVSKGGRVFVKNGGTAGGTALTYGDGSASFNTSWHIVETAASTPLTGVIRLSYCTRGMMALTVSGAMYVWGDNVFLAGGSGVNDYNRATLMSNTTGVTPVDISIVSRFNYDANSANATQFFLGSNGKVYGLGENYRGPLGQGNEVDATDWVVVRGPDGIGDLTNIVQIGTNNPYLFTNQYASIGALNSSGNLYLWGHNARRMIGSDTLGVGASADSTFYVLPRIPPNFNYNKAGIGYFEMGGHTTAAFLAGSSKFCYIGHKINGSMGDGIGGDEERWSYDCINTPEEFVCPPAPIVGCPLPSANDIVASAAHSTLTINGAPSVAFWGEAASSAEPGINMAAARTLYEYNGDPKGVAASGISTGSSAQSTQMWVQTTAGIWGWGYSANTIISNRLNSVPISELPLPAGVTASQVNFIRSSRGGIALVTTAAAGGNVWVRAGAGSACSPRIYGDGSSTLDVAGATAWHQVTTAAATPLTGVIELSFGGTAALAITNSGTAYVWGDQTYLGDGSAASDRNRAALMTLHSDFSASMVPRTAEIIKSGTLEAVQFILGTNNRIYSIGRNANGALGNSTASTAAISTTWNLLSLTGVRKMSSNNPYSDGFYTVGAILLTGNVYLWGSNSNGMIGQPLGTTHLTTPTLATTVASNDATNFEIGGYGTIIFAKSTSQFYFAGRSRGGSRANGSADGDVTPFTLSGTVPNCANVSFDISGNLFNDNDGLTDNVVDGAGIQTLRTTDMYANLLDEAGYVIATTPISPTGTYSFVGYPFSNYAVQVSPTIGSIFALAPTTALPSNWAFSGEQIGTTASTGIDAGIPDGRIPVALSANRTNVNFGVQQLPTPVPDTLPRIPNPGGTINRTITTAFTGVDTLGTIAKIRITSFPTNTTTIKIGTTTYTSGTWPAPGVTFNVGTSVDIDPIDGAVIATIPFKVIDNADAESTNPASLTVPFLLAPPIANNITAPRLNSSDTAKAIPQLKASNPSGTAITNYKVLTLPAASEGILYYCAAAPTACALGTLTPVVAGVDINPAQSASLYFDPVQSFTGTLSFTYSATDQNNLVSNVANYIIPVTNNPPVTQNISTAQILDTHSASPIPDLIAADIDGTIASYTVSAIPASSTGVLSYCSNGTDTCTGTMINITGTTVLTPAQMTTIEFDPVLGFSGNFIFNYIATDNNGNTSNTSTYTIPVVPLGSIGGNFPPVATNIVAQNINNSLGATPIPNLLGTDPDGVIVTYTIGSTIPNAATEGTLYYCMVPGAGCALTAVTAGMTLSPLLVGTLHFDPLPGFVGNTSFTYTVTDNNGTPLTSSPANYLIPVVNNPPVANPSSVSPILNTLTDPTLLPPLSGNDADGIVVQYNITSVPAATQGTLKYCATAPGVPCTAGTLSTISSPLTNLDSHQIKTIHFIPNSGFTGDYVFNFTTVDNNGQESQPAPFTIPVVEIFPSTIGQPPVAYSFNAPAINSLSTASLPSALSGTDPDGTIATYTITSLPVASHGALTYCTTPPAGCNTPVSLGMVLTPDQAATLVFTPNANFTGIATFNYINTDNSGNTSNTATVTVPVNNNPPVANNVNNTAINRSSPPVTLNPLVSTDEDGTVETYRILSIPTPDQGVLSLCTTPPSTGCTPVTPGQVILPADIGKLSFTPDTGVQSPVVSFLYSSLDNSGNLSNVATVNIPIANAFELPMDLISFTAIRQNINALIAWKIGVEEAGDKYMLEHSLNASNWNTINTQTAKASSGIQHSYDFLHLNVPSGKNFYRLKLSDVSNNISYSPVRMLNFDDNASQSVFLQPNPVADKLFISSSDGEAISKLVLMDISGRMISEYTGLSSGSTIDMSALNAGLYLINITDSKGKEQIFKVSKNK